MRHRTLPQSYTTHLLPNFVHSYLGRPLTLEQLHRGEFVIFGSDRAIFVKAQNAIAAREAITECVRRLDGISDGRRK